MAGTDRREAPVLGGPAVILIEPQLGENIGAVARAMLNFGLTELRLVRPRANWLNERTRAMASGADRVLDGATLFPTTAAAIADCQHIYATTARHRDLLKPVATARFAAETMRAQAVRGERIGVLFGPERVGLHNDDVVLAEALVTVPLNPAFSSLNLGQAVVILGYEWFASGDAPAPLRLEAKRARLATREEVLGLFGHLESELDASGYFTNIPDKRRKLVYNIRNSLQRGALLDQDVRTLHGIIKSLAGRKLPGRRRARGKPSSVPETS